MKKMMMGILLVISSFSAQAFADEELTDVLICQEKWSNFRIYESEGSYNIARQVVTDRIKGSNYVNGQIWTESYGGLENVKSVSKTEDTVTFHMEDAETLSFKLVKSPKENVAYEVVITSSNPDIASQVSDILGLVENPLEFYTSETCSINK